ncbi:hypothetical protein P4N68_09410 [Corynebacterium felinum]|uniref:ABC-type polysaccharide/polyol phosphate transport system ATPase subunit n=1 Tax=Corynebacterium felinum TaxID=131318 RepID=A0ABU2B885_9CORY|nr:hypothetical protein [Corynebacterium felinum]MDF5821292.1 hypothetical protein [Corynebacterium felinum]MDR7354827.1 ABC-type polysaccharide/polyol phosphate transport system ATPase subunit [Corynebacterium felinum]WJY94187.1 hypothetical protein CFELI_02725 [Corynebacterium felinum]
MITGLIGLNGAGKTTHLRHLHDRVPGAYLPDHPCIPLELSACELLTRVGLMKKNTGGEAARAVAMPCATY